MRLELEEIKKSALTVLDTEAHAIIELKNRIDENFLIACEYLHQCSGRIVVMGVGKSGHIANKIASTLASTGNPAFSMHPTEAAHGDLGMLCSNDVTMLISHSGEASEIKALIAPIKRLKIPIIALAGNTASSLAKAATVCLDVGIEQEACPLGLAPTASTTATLAMGDALAIVLSQTKGFTSDDFARTHPSGQIGRRLMLLVENLMCTGDDVPGVLPETPLLDALLEMSAKGLGMTLVIDNDQRVLGIFTDGDLRRCIDKRVDLRAATIGQTMTVDFHAAKTGDLAFTILEKMESRKINAMPVLDDGGRLAGAISIHILLHAGL